MIQPQCDRCDKPAFSRIVQRGESTIDRCREHQLPGTPVPDSTLYPYRYGDTDVWRLEP